jgi:hypothetical protein
MSIYILLIIIIYFGYHLIYLRVSKNAYYVLVGTALLLIIGLRSTHLGLGDTEGVYTTLINRAVNLGYKDILTRGDFMKDVSFYLLVKTVSFISKDLHFIIFALSAPLVISVTYLVKNLSPRPWLSYMFFLGLGYYLMSYFLLRHVIALSCVICAGICLLKKNYKGFAVWLIIAILFHQTAIIFAAAPFVSKIKIGIRQLTAIIFAYIFAIALSNLAYTQLFRIINLLFGKSNRYSSFNHVSNGLGYSGFLINLCVLILEFICITRLNRKIIKSRPGYFLDYNIDDESTLALYNFSVVNTIIMAFSITLGEFYRLASFYGIFNIVLIPISIRQLKSKKIRLLISYILGALSIIYFLAVNLQNQNGLPYKFFWQL